jgi:hypothetical protein
MDAYWKDVAERVARTFISTFLVTYLTAIGPVSDGTVLADLANADLAQRAAVAALAATGTFVLALLTKGIGPSDSASVIKPPATPSEDDGYPSIWD